MNNVALVLYIIRVRSTTENKYVSLDNIDGRTFIDIFTEYCNNRKNISSNTNSQKALCILKLQTENEIFHGKLETGSFGYSSNIKSISTSKTTHQKGNNEAEMFPLFFYSHIPSNSYKGLIALEKFRTFGCKTILTEDLNKFLWDRKYNIKVSLHPILPTEIAQQYLKKGNICKLRLVKHAIPRDIADTYKDKFKYGEFGTFEYVINPKRTYFLPFKQDINKFLNKEIGLKNIIEIHGIDYDNIKVEIAIGDKKRTISLNNLERLSGNIDISDEVKFDKEGHPVYDSILKISKDIVSQYSLVIDYQNDNINSISHDDIEVDNNEQSIALP